MSGSAGVVHRLLVVVRLGSTALLPDAFWPAARKPPNAEVAAQLDAAKAKVAELTQNADEMASLLRNDAGWQSHAAMLSQIKDHVKNVERSVAKMREEREEAPAWQRQAMDRMVPMLQEVATNTSAAIEAS